MEQGTMSLVEHVIDLDAFADRLQQVMGEWTPWAAVGPLTWRDEAAEWPQTITLDRPSVQVPESVGFTLHRHAPEDALTIVVWTGGWADLGYLFDGEAYNFSPMYRDADDAYTAVVKDVEEFRALR